MPTPGHQPVVEVLYPGKMVTGTKFPAIPTSENQPVAGAEIRACHHFSEVIHFPRGRL
jgi:hypothetical protein